MYLCERHSDAATQWQLSCRRHFQINFRYPTVSVILIFHWKMLPINDEPVLFKEIFGAEAFQLSLAHLYPLIYDWKRWFASLCIISRIIAEILSCFVCDQKVIQVTPVSSRTTMCITTLWCLNNPLFYYGMYWLACNRDKEEILFAKWWSTCFVTRTYITVFICC